jgi:hypothetical protein
MKNFIFCFVTLLILILSFVLFTNTDEQADSEPNQLRTNTPSTAKINKEEDAPITKTVDEKAPGSEVQDLSSNELHLNKYFQDWSDDEKINDTLLDTWGKNLSEAFFAEHDSGKLLDRSRDLSDENDFLLKFKKGIYKGYVFLIKKDGSYDPDPQPFIASLSTEKLQGKKILKAHWVSWKKSTGADGVPHPILQNNFLSSFQEDEAYKNIISFSEKAWGQCS